MNVKPPPIEEVPERMRMALEFIELAESHAEYAPECQVAHLMAEQLYFALCSLGYSDAISARITFDGGVEFITAGVFTGGKN